MRPVLRVSLLVLVFFVMSGRSPAYLAAMPTLGKIIVDSSNIVVLQVDKISRDK